MGPLPCISHHGPCHYIRGLEEAQDSLSTPVEEGASSGPTEALACSQSQLPGLMVKGPFKHPAAGTSLCHLLAVAAVAGTRAEASPHWHTGAILTPSSILA